MKKLITFFISIMFIASASGQSGSGTSGNPYYGTISGTPTWDPVNYTSGEVYVGSATLGEDLTIDGGHLTILSGIKVIFMTTGSELIITNSGRLTADGTPASQITFTRYFPTYNYWGHIAFQPSAGTSLMDNCVIEYGDVSSFGNTDPKAAGGGLFLGTSNVTISYCKIQHNKAQWGGGIFVYSDQSPSISNCYFYDNFAKESGGGAYLYDRTGSVVTNCIFYNNSCQGYSLNIYTGGGLAAQSSSSAKIVNCTFANNSSSRTEGQGIMLYNSSNARVINSIFWGSNKEIFCSSTPASTIINSAYQGITYTDGAPVNSIVLNSSNGASDGPNFITAGSDWSIKFISPCRDAGTTPSPTVPNDYIGNYRIGPYDIGAYEVQYSRWKTTPSDNTSWTNTGNWEQNLNPAAAGSTGDVIIPAGSSSFPNISSVSIGTGKYLIIDPKAQATFGTLDNSSNGTLWLKSDSHGINDSIASLKVGTYTPGGTEKIELYLQGNSSMWHYISPPVASIATSVFYYSGSGAAVTEYRENLIDNDMNNGWVTSTGFHLNPSTLGWESGSPIWSNLLVGHGYNYFGTSSKTFTIQGAINTGDVTVNLTYNSGPFTPNPTQQGYNLIGNPFTCGLDWDKVVIDASNTVQAGWSNVEQAIYFRKNGVNYYYIGGSTVPGDLSGNPIAPMQGFFIHSNSNNFSLKIPAATAKVHTLNPRFKGLTIVPSIRLQLDYLGITDETLIKFDEKATMSFDNNFDARKLSSGSGEISISSSLGGTEYAINAIPFPESNVIVPLIFNANSTGSYTIKATEILGLENYTVYLNDKLQNTTVNLSQINSYSFSAIAGVSTDRFTITITNVLTALPETSVSNKPFNIYSSGEQINIQTLSDDWSGKQGSIKVLDLTGRVISLNSNIEFSRDEIKQVPVSGVSGIYLVEIRSGIKRYVWKVVVK